MRQTWIPLLLLCSATMWGWGATQKKVVATLTDVRGGVEMKAQGAKEWTAVKGTQPLGEGDAVRVGKGGKATLIQSDCPLRALKEDETVVVSASRKWLTGVTNKPVTEAQHASLLRLLDSAAQSSRSQPTMVRPFNTLEDIALSPRSENVLDGRPTFVWKDYGQGSRYEVEVFQSDALVWEAKTTEARIAYPADRTPLKPGTYQWQIYVKTSEGRQDADSADFTVLDAATAKKVQADIAAARALVPEESGVNLPLISLYVEHKLYAPAESALQKALTTAPDDSTL